MDVLNQDINIIQAHKSVEYENIPTKEYNHGRFCSQMVLYYSHLQLW